MQKINKKHIFYIKDNLFDNIINKIQTSQTSHTIIVPHVCNNINLFDAGFAGQISIRYPVVKANFHLLGKDAKLGYTQFVKAYENTKKESEIVFANMISQNGTIGALNKRPLNYAFLMRCMLDVKQFIQNKTKEDTEQIIEIHCPKFGSGLAGGQWSFIHQLIIDIWKNIPVYVYDYDNRNKI
jgi:hypothetical protein